VPSGDETHTISGTYSDTILNAAGCDSVMTINLTLGTTSGTLTVSTCDVYTVPSGDETYSTSGTYFDTIPNGSGCDSILTVQLTVVDVNATATFNGLSLAASPTGAAYQWVNCLSDFSPISGANSSVYTPTTGGVYAVIVTQNGCSDTSACVTAIVDGFEDHLDAVNVEIYPNPTKGISTLQFATVHAKIDVQVFDVAGRKVQNISAANTANIALLLEEPAGLYFLQIVADDRSTVLRLVVQ
jgi:hypothetical protein